LVKKAEANYWVDITIGIAGVASAISGLVFLLPGDLTTGVFGISYQAWNVVHTWSSLAVIAGVGAHLVLHWKWMAAMTKQVLSSRSRQGVKEHASDLADDGAQGRPLSRRAFLAFAGTAAVVTGAIAAGYKAIIDADPAEASQSGNQLAAAQQEGGVACPFGLINDPYPGRCRHYVDSNGDGICDYSVPGSGSNLSAGNDGGLSRRRHGFGQP
jgi:hypothetical protein